jgi:hypothetical protein
MHGCAFSYVEKEACSLRFIKKVSFWFLIVSLMICLFNLSGHDDKNLLLGYTSPLLLWLNPWLTRNTIENELIEQLLPYGLHLFSWLFAGILIDRLISLVKPK